MNPEAALPVSTTLATIELLAVVASAVYGILLACRKQLDVVGVFSVALATAFGGGTLRDLFLGRRPLFWITNDHYVAIVLVLALAGVFAPAFIRRFEKHLAVPDALGLALFSLTGAAFAVQMGTSMLIASLLAVVTGTFGGVIADVICNEIPALFRSGPLYATCAFAGAWVHLLALRMELPPGLALLAGFVVIVLFRLAAVKWNLRLPAASLDH
jgi:uncharacterized membrane protein YeiH